MNKAVCLFYNNQGKHNFFSETQSMVTRRKLNNIISSAALALIVTIPFNTVADDTVVFGGIDAKEDSSYLYAGLIHAFNGFGVDGPALKVFVGAGEFDYDTEASGIYPGGNVPGSSRAFDLMVGYRKHIGDYQLGVYAGVNSQTIDQELIKSGGTITDTDAVGSDAGLKVEFEVTRNAAQGHYLDVRGNYSNVFDTYWTRGRLGWRAGSVIVGPEVAFLGNDDFDQDRFGVFAIIGGSGNVNVNLSVGQANTDGNGGDSAYGSFGISTTF